jgi:predicted enzyme related to lactoylglutathione lyase
MSERTELLPGSFCWPELATPDSAKAKAYYSGLFGWTPADAPSSGGTYTFLQLRGKDVAALRTLSEKEKGEGIPSYFLSYVSTASADASAARVTELGGAVLFGPFDVMDVGRMAVVRDPAGLAFGLWEARGHIGARLVGENATLCWTEIVTPDEKGAERFYCPHFGWTVKPSEGGGPAGYLEIYRGEQPIGGILPMKGKWWGDVPGQFMPYFLVRDCDVAATKASELGGGAMVPPMDIPHVGRFAVLRDDQGAHFSVIAMAQGAAD